MSLRLTRESQMGARGPSCQEARCSVVCHHSLGHVAHPSRAAQRVRHRSQGLGERLQRALELNPLGNAPKTRLLRMGLLTSARRLETVTHMATGRDDQPRQGW